MARILVTGAAGYIGSLACRQLLAAGYQVRGIDNLLHGGNTILGLISLPGFEFRKGDIRDADFVRAAVADCDGIIHLAAIVGEPACNRDEDLAWAVNYEGSRQLFELAEAAGTGHLIFVSTCSNYGISDAGQLATETSALKPISAYAKSKVEIEKILLEESNHAGKITVCRLATVYGMGPRPRFDLTVNEFTRDAFIKKHLLIFGEQFWRPYVHVYDVGTAFRLILEAPRKAVDREVFNVGHSDENFQKKMLVDLIQQKLDDVKVEYVARNVDPRDYQVGFEKIRERLNFQPLWTVDRGIDQVIACLRDGLIADPYADLYRN